MRLINEFLPILIWFAVCASLAGLSAWLFKLDFWISFLAVALSLTLSAVFDDWDDRPD